MCLTTWLHNYFIFVKSVVLLNWVGGRGDKKEIWDNKEWLVLFHITDKSAVNKRARLKKKIKETVSRRRITSKVYYHDERIVQKFKNLSTDILGPKF